MTRYVVAIILLTLATLAIVWASHGPRWTLFEVPGLETATRGSIDL